MLLSVSKGNLSGSSFGEQIDYQLLPNLLGRTSRQHHPISLN